MAHSGGSFLGIQVAARAPELYSAYIGMGQMTFQLESERLAFEYMLAKYKANGNASMVRRLEAAPSAMTFPLPAAYDALRDSAMHGLGVGTTRDMKSVPTGIFLATWLNREYMLGEKLNIWRGKKLANRTLRKTAFGTDITKQVIALDLPVYFLEGLYDYTCSYALAREYFKRLSAPIKGFYTFGKSAHGPLFEEPEKARRILLENVLPGTNSLADAN